MDAKLKITISLFLAMTCAPAFSQQANPMLSGDSFYLTCSQNKAVKADCAWYVGGFVMGSAEQAHKSRAADRLFCPKTPLSFDQYLDVVVQWLSINPKKRSLPIAQAVATALSSTFPCH